MYGGIIGEEVGQAARNSVVVCACKLVREGRRQGPEEVVAPWSGAHE